MLIPLYQYRAKVIDVNDDGSLAIDFDLGFGISHKEGSAWVVGTEAPGAGEELANFLKIEETELKGNDYLAETSFSQGKLLVELFWESAGVIMLASEVLYKALNVVS